MTNEQRTDTEPSNLNIEPTIPQGQAEIDIDEPLGLLPLERALRGHLIEQTVVRQLRTLARQIERGEIITPGLKGVVVGLIGEVRDRERFDVGVAGLLDEMDLDLLGDAIQWHREKYVQAAREDFESGGRRPTKAKKQGG